MRKKPDRKRGREMDREGTAAALRETEERFRAIFETAQDCIFVKNLNLEYTHVNPAMEKLFGRQGLKRQKSI